MPQTFLPIFPDNSIPINELFSYVKKNGAVYYFHGFDPFFKHDEKDLQSFRMITSQMVVVGNCKQVHIVKAFGVTAISVKRYVKLYRKEGISGFYKVRKARGAGVMKPEVLEQAQKLLNEGKTRKKVAEKLEIKDDTLYRAILTGKLREKKRF